MRGLGFTWHSDTGGNVFTCIQVHFFPPTHNEGSMLLIGRKLNERIVIGDDIEIVVCSIKSKKHVSIGIKAPPGVKIARAELLVPPEADKKAEST